MAGRRRRISTRCMWCRMHLEHCICAQVETLELTTRVVVVMHHREWSKTTSTVPLLRQAVPATDIRIRAETREQLDLTDLLDPARRLLLLYPADDAVPLTRELVAADPRPITLVLPDGSWRQAAKIGRREPVLRDLPRVTLPSGPPSRYRLRAEPMREGLATFEAAARALGVIEGPAVRASLERTFDAMVEATLLTRKVPPRRW